MYSILVDLTFLTLCFVLFLITLYIYVCLYRFDQDGTRVSVVQYFKRQYNYCLKCIHWPCLQAGSDSRPIYLPMEVMIMSSSFLLLPYFVTRHLFCTIFVSSLQDMLCMQVCNILEGQRYSRKLNERQVTSILRMACERPTQRQSSILEVNLITIGSLTIVAFTICAFKEVPTLLYLFR